jgi:hypothetical protein
VLSIAASNDGLSTAAKIDGAANMLPADADFTVLDGANHAQFGDYGTQPGDLDSTVTTEAVREEITGLLVGFLR